jgi:hypothetical protein
MGNEIVMMLKFLRMNKLLLKMIMRINELNGDWNPINNGSS